MQFPNFHVPFAGNGTIIGLNAVVHVVISHGLAIGAFAMIVLADWYAQNSVRGNARAWERFNRRFLKFTVVAVTTVGAATGAGIWFTTGALAPRAVASMLRIFFWPWFIEWMVFVAEVILLLAIYGAWDRMARRRRTRLALSLGYLALAFASAVLITGILGFMLTSGQWPSTRNFWEAFLNPSFAPQLLARLAMGCLLGALAAMGMVVWRRGDETFQHEALRLFAMALGTSLVLFALGLVWYCQAVPRAYLTRSLFAVLTSHLAQAPWVFYAANLAAFGVLALLFWAAWSRRLRAARWIIGPAVVLAIGLTAEFERIREFIRGPFLMPGYMYANEVLVDEEPQLDRTGFVVHAAWAARADRQQTVYTAGATLFAHNCTACHTVDGVNGIRRRIAGRSEDGLFVLLGHTHEMISFMPPLAATHRERRALARFLYDLGQGEIPLESRARLTIGPRHVDHE